MRQCVVEHQLWTLFYFIHLGASLFGHGGRNGRPPFAAAFPSQMGNRKIIFFLSPSLSFVRRAKMSSFSNLVQTNRRRFGRLLQLNSAVVILMLSDHKMHCVSSVSTLCCAKPIAHRADSHAAGSYSHAMEHSGCRLGHHLTKNGRCTRTGFGEEE